MASLPEQSRLPSATYRVQFRGGTGFEQARAIVGYLRALGVTDLYASPVLRAREGSTHGYDVVDPGAIDPALGTREDFGALGEELRENGMGLLLDIVPNHMAVSAENARWWDVLLHGRRSAYATFFDIDWEAGGGRVLVPVLGAPYGEVLDDITVDVDAVGYFEHVFPLSGSSAGRKHEVLERQHYRLAHWRLASHEINYRRFFDITDLIALRADDPFVYDETHALVHELIEDGTVTSLRVDHIDGMTDPGAYLGRLAGTGAPILVEKILGDGEELPEAWPVAGTTGYEFIRIAEDLFVDPKGWRALTEGHGSFDDVLYVSKKHVLDTLFGAEVNALVQQLRERADADLVARDYPSRELERALVELTACLPVYRTYIRRSGARAEDRRTIAAAAAEAERRAGSLPALRWLAEGLVDDDWTAFAMRWQQLTGPAMAKGAEDTTLYRWVPFIARNEVGGSPGTPPLDVQAFHGAMRARLRGSLNAGSTHDTKRSEDVRARLAVLSELTQEWQRFCERRSEPEGIEPSDALLCYQTVVGAWPLEAREERGFAKRVEGYMLKAAREAKLRTSWIDQDESYERALRRFVRGLFKDQRFVRDVRALVDRIALPGAVNSLAALTLRICAPGIPDFYQGSELWHLRLVDPDNRAPVDFRARAKVLAELERRETDDVRALVRELVEAWPDGRIKMWVTRRALALRTEHDPVFEHGDYVPLEVSGPRADNVVAFARRYRGSWAVCAVPRLTSARAAGAMPVGKFWSTTTIALPKGAPAGWRNVLTDEELSARDKGLRVSAVLGSLPVAVLAPA